MRAVSNRDVREHCLSEASSDQGTLASRLAVLPGTS